MFSFGQTPEQKLANELRVAREAVSKTIFSGREDFINKFSDRIIPEIHRQLRNHYSTSVNTFIWSLSRVPYTFYYPNPGLPITSCKQENLSFEEYERIVNLIQSTFIEPDFLVVPRGTPNENNYQPFEWEIRLLN